VTVVRCRKLAAAQSSGCQSMTLKYLKLIEAYIGGSGSRVWN
jgi:hypothetical protein